MHTSYTEISPTQQELEVEISPADFEMYLERAAQRLSESLEVQGFRKGHVPRNIVEREFGSARLYNEAAEIAVQATYTKAIQEVAARGAQVPGEESAGARPGADSRTFFDSLPSQTVQEVQVTKLAPKNPFVYKIVFSVPSLELPDNYRDIARRVREKEKRDITVETKEVDDTLQWLAKNNQRHPLRQKPQKDLATANDEQSSKIGDQQQTTNDSGKPSGAGRESGVSVDDDFARSLGNFQNLEELKKNIREGIHFEKEKKEKDRVRLAIMKEIIRQSKREIPERVVLAQISRMEEEFRRRIVQMGLDFDEYLTKIQKKKEELHRGWQEQAKERVEVSLALDVIAKREGIQPSGEEVQKEAEKLLNRHTKTKDAEKRIDPARLRESVRGILTSEKTFEFLENC